MVYLNRGIDHIELSQFQEATQNLNKAIELDPNHALAYFNLGLVNTSLGQEDLATKDLYRACELDEDLC